MASLGDYRVIRSFAPSSSFLSNEESVNIRRTKKKIAMFVSTEKDDCIRRDDDHLRLLLERALFLECPCLSSSFFIRLSLHPAVLLYVFTFFFISQ